MPSSSADIQSLNRKVGQIPGLQAQINALTLQNQNLKSTISIQDGLIGALRASQLNQESWQSNTILTVSQILRLPISPIDATQQITLDDLPAHARKIMAELDALRLK